MIKKIKILYLITGLKTGGAEIILKNLVKKLDKQKFDLVVVSITPIGEIGQDMLKDGIKVLSLKVKRKWNFLMILRLSKIIKQEKPIILHAHLFHANLLGRIINLFYKDIINISTIHSIDFGGNFREWLIKITDRFCDTTVVVSQKVSDMMLKKKIVLKNKIKTIYNGVDLNFFYSQNNSKKHQNYPMLLSAGRLVQAKGYTFLIKAIKILKTKYPKMLLTVLGEGEERKKLEQQIKSLNLEKNILLLGNKNNIIDYLKIDSIFISSSLSEGLGMSIIEAMACGLLTVATKVGGVPEIIEDKKSGFLAEPGNVENLVNKIDYVINLSKDKKQEISKNARQVVENKFSLKKMVENYEKLYEKLICDTSIIV
ncbi:MAG: glycosyltransferase [Candidatus Falkowbacteria bacterium]